MVLMNDFFFISYNFRSNFIRMRKKNGRIEKKEE